MVLVDAETGEHEPKHEMGRLFLWTELQEPEQEILLAETVNELALDEDFIAGNSSEMWETLSHALVWEVTFRGWVLVKQITYRQAEMFYRQKLRGLVLGALPCSVVSLSKGVAGGIWNMFGN